MREELRHLQLLTQDCGFPVELLRQVGPFGQAVQVPLQDVPAHLVVEGKAELGMNLKTGIKLVSECFHTLVSRSYRCFIKH